MSELTVYPERIKKLVDILNKVFNMGDLYIPLDSGGYSYETTRKIEYLARVHEIMDDIYAIDMGVGFVYVDGKGFCREARERIKLQEARDIIYSE